MDTIFTERNEKTVNILIMFLIIYFVYGFWLTIVKHTVDIKAMIIYFGLTFPDSTWIINFIIDSSSNYSR